MLHPQAVVEDKIVHELAVERVNVKQDAGMEIHELFLQGAVEPLAVRIHLGRLGVGMVVREVEVEQSFCKVLFELRAIVREHKDKRKRKNFLAQGKELRRGLGGVRGSGPGEASPGVNVFKRNEVAPCAIDEPLNSIERYHVPGILRLEILGLPEHSVAVGFNDSSLEGDFLWEHAQASHIGNQSSDGLWLRAVKLLHFAELREQRK